jgi:hypothetical protein
MRLRARLAASDRLGGTDWAFPPFLLDKITSLSHALRQQRINATNSTLKLELAQAK